MSDSPARIMQCMWSHYLRIVNYKPRDEEEAAQLREESQIGMMYFYEGYRLCETAEWRTDGMFNVPDEAIASRIVFKGYDETGREQFALRWLRKEGSRDVD